MSLSAVDINSPSSVDIHGNQNHDNKFSGSFERGYTDVYCKITAALDRTPKPADMDERG